MTYWIAPEQGETHAIAVRHRGDRTHHDQNHDPFAARRCNRGDGVGSDRAPQPGVQVTALQRRMVDGQPTLVSDSDNHGGLTDDQGQYRIWGLTPGVYAISATPPAGLTTARSITDADLQWAAGELQRGPGGNAAGSPSPRPPDDGRVVSYAPVYYPGVVDPAGAATVTVGPAAEQDGVDLALQVADGDGQR